MAFNRTKAEGTGLALILAISAIGIGVIAIGIGSPKHTENGVIQCTVPANIQLGTCGATFKTVFTRTPIVFFQESHPALPFYTYEEQLPIPTDNTGILNATCTGQEWGTLRCDGTPPTEYYYLSTSLVDVYRFGLAINMVSDATGNYAPSGSTARLQWSNGTNVASGFCGASSMCTCPSLGGLCVLWNDLTPKIAIDGSKGYDYNGVDLSIGFNKAGVGNPCSAELGIGFAIQCHNNTTIDWIGTGNSWYLQDPSWGFRKASTNSFGNERIMVRLVVANPSVTPKTLKVQSVWLLKYVAEKAFIVIEVLDAGHFVLGIQLTLGVLPFPVTSGNIDWQALDPGCVPPPLTGNPPASICGGNFL